MITLSDGAKTTQALQQWASRSHFPTDLSSADLRGFSRELRMRSVFSARLTNARVLSRMDDLLTRGINGELNRSQFVAEMLKEVQSTGYRRDLGFLEDMADVPAAEQGSIQDFSSESRWKLIWDTNISMTFNFARVNAGNGDHARYWYPAWELARLAWRRVPRGTPESHSAGWQRRWLDAGASVNWEGVHQAHPAESGQSMESMPSVTRMIALKDSPIWQALGDGAGGYEDTLGNPYPPFAFNSGMAIRGIGREECISMGLLGTPEPVECKLSPDMQEIKDAMDTVAESLREHARLAKEDMIARYVRTPKQIEEARDAHQRFLDSLVADLPEEKGGAAA
jgi:hypothetical protein